MSKSDNPKAINVTLLEKEYLIACPPEERHALMRSAEFLDSKMREIRDTGKVIGTERIAVMAALNIVHELLDNTPSKSPNQETVKRRLQSLQNKVEEALFKTRQLEI